MEEKELICYIHKFFVYENGKLLRTDRKNSNGSIDRDGYLIIKIKGKQYKAHRLVYAYFNNEFPKGEIDHINRNKLDNRVENLRVVSRIENIKNRTILPNKNTGVEGVYIDNTKGLLKKLCFKYKKKTYRYYTVEEAIKSKNALRSNEK